jgi:hypothetical protein
MANSIYEFLFGKEKKDVSDKKNEAVLRPSGENDMDFIKGMRGMGNGHKKKSNKKK